MGVLLIHLLIHLVNSFWVAHRRNYKDTHRNKPENYFLGLLTIMGVLLIIYHSHRNKPENYFLGLLTIMGVLLII